MMNFHRWGRYFLGISLALLLYGCLVGNAKKLEDAAQATGQTAKIYLPVVIAPPLPPPPGPPMATNSIYVTSLDSNTLFNQGCALGNRDLGLAGKQDSLVVLDFGYPRMINGQFGANLFAPALPATMANIAAAVENFGFGYWWCVNTDFDSHLRIGVGTSNYDGSIYSTVTYGHGQAWAQMVNQVNDWFRNTCERGCDGQVDAVGANDLELSWASYAKSIDWLNGYDASNGYLLYNFGAIPGCPYLASPGAQCGGAGYYWTKEQVWMVTFGLSPVYPVPEIYRTDGVNAQQWYLMSVYSYLNHGVKMQFIGPMSQYQACLQRGCASSIKNTPSMAWQQLYNLLNGDARTSGEALPYVTDILWLNETIPSVGALQEGSPGVGGPEAGGPEAEAPEAAAPEAAAPTPVPYAGSPADQLQAALRSSPLSAADRAALEEKLALTRKTSAQPAFLTVKPGPKSPNQSFLPHLADEANMAAADEILDGSEGLVHTWEADIHNLWQGVRNEIFYQVLAGASVDDPNQGLVLVIDANPKLTLRSQHYYLTGEPTGRLRVQQVQGSRVLLSTANGGTLVFDLNSRTFEK